MTVSGSGRTREKDTRAPARGPFCVLGSSLAGEEGVLLQGGVLPFGGPLSVCMPGARPICGKTRGSPSLSAPPYGRASARSLHLLRAVRKVWRSTTTQPVHSHACTDRQPLSLFYIRCRRSRSLVLLGSHAGGSRQIHRAGQPGGISLFLMSFWVLYERVVRRVGEFEGARGSFLAQGKVPLAPTILSSSHPLTFVVPSLS